MKKQIITIDYNTELKLPKRVKSVDTHPDPGSILHLDLRKLSLRMIEGYLFDIEDKIDEIPVDLLIVQELIRVNRIPASWKKVEGVACFGTKVYIDLVDGKGFTHPNKHVPVVCWDGVKWAIYYQNFSWNSWYEDDGVYCAVIK